MAVVDWTDPCARAAALRDAYYELLRGGAETLIRYRGPEGEREVRMKPADTERLRTEYLSAQAECDAAAGGPNPGRRFAIRGGAFRG